MAHPGRHDGGFTLIELMVVTLIIGILAAIAIPKYAATKDRARLASIKTDLRNIMVAEEAYYVDWRTYTGTLSAMIFRPSAENTITVAATAADFKATIINSLITSGANQCSVEVGTGSTDDGKIICS